MKVWDIVQPKDDWERNYAHLEFLRLELYQIADRWLRGARTIEIKYETECMRCGAPTFDLYCTYSCEDAENLNDELSRGK